MAIQPTTLCRIGSRGQITIPADILKRLNLKVGDYVQVTVEGPHIILIPTKKPSDHGNRT